MENVRETTNEKERRREDGGRGRKRERKRKMIRLSPERRTARRMSRRTRGEGGGYRGTEETGPRPNMIIELGERCERSTL